MDGKEKERERVERGKGRKGGGIDRERRGKAGREEKEGERE